MPTTFGWIVLDEMMRPMKHCILLARLKSACSKPLLPLRAHDRDEILQIIMLTPLFDQTKNRASRAPRVLNETKPSGNTT